jgi:hypothetical protein
MGREEGGGGRAYSFVTTILLLSYRVSYGNGHTMISLLLVFKRVI